jgi:hypothetical protein
LTIAKSAFATLQNADEHAIVQDWFASNRALMHELNRMVVKEKRIVVKTAGKLREELIDAIPSSSPSPPPL